MEEGYRKIIWGLFFTTFHINLLNIPLLPAFIGWLIVFGGIDNLLKEREIKSFYKARISTFVIFIISLIMQIISWNGIQNEITWFLPIIYFVLDLLIIYYLLDGSIQYLYDFGKVSDAKHYYGIQRAYSIIYVLNTIIACVAIAIGSQGLSTLTAVIGVLLMISFMINIRTIKNIKVHIDVIL